MVKTLIFRKFWKNLCALAKICLAWTRTQSGVKLLAQFVMTRERHEVYGLQWHQKIALEWESRTKGEMQIDLLWVWYCCTNNIPSEKFPHCTHPVVSGQSPVSLVGPLDSIFTPQPRPHLSYWLVYRIKNLNPLLEVWYPQMPLSIITAHT